MHIFALTNFIKMTEFICIAIAITSILGFNNAEIINKLIFDPYLAHRKNQLYRLISCAMVHADVPHLAFNLIALYSFGAYLEMHFKYTFPQNYYLFYGALLLGGQVASVLPTYVKHRNSVSYRSLGASGMVTAVVFATIIVEPWGIKIWGIIPGIVFGVLYLAYEHYASNNTHDNINHEAHYWGGLFGIAFMFISKPTAIFEFIQKLINPVF